MKNEDFESQEELGMGGKMKNWIQDNIRIIISVLIVIVIAGGIYSYSNRTQEIVYDDELALEDEFTIEEEGEGVAGDEIVGEENQTTETEEEVQINEEPVKTTTETETKSEPEIISQETEDSFLETAVVGDGKTHLARKALASYLEKNNDSELTAEHKIYIEDFLRKNVNHTGSVEAGDQISFSKNLIKDGIEKSKTLTDKQLENLEKYSARVPSLR